MRTSPALVAMEAPAETAGHGVDEIIRTLTGLIEIVSRERETTKPSGSHTEEVLIDTEVDGARYLLVRMRRPGAGGVSSPSSGWARARRWWLNCRS